MAEQCFVHSLCFPGFKIVSRLVDKIQIRIYYAKKRPLEGILYMHQWFFVLFLHFNDI